MAKSKRRNLKQSVRRRRRSRNRKVFGGADEEKPKETSVFGSLFGSAETTPIDDEKKQEEAKKAEEAKEAEEAKKAEETKEAEEVKAAEETKVAEEAKEAPSIFSSVFGPANPEPPTASDEQPIGAVVAIPDGSRVTKRKRKKRKTNKKRIARCTAYCRMQAKKRFCPKERMPTPYYQ